jgi:hypothetical protein
MSYPPFIIRFVKNIEKEIDDVLKILPGANDTFEWVYREHDQKVKHRTTLMRNSVNARLETLFKLVTYDCEPPLQVQIDVPGFPQVLIPFDDLDVVKGFIQDSLDMTMGAWPTRDYSEDCCECEEDGDEDNDMPPLEAHAPTLDQESTIDESESMPPLVNADGQEVTETQGGAPDDYYNNYNYYHNHNYMNNPNAWSWNNSR